MRIDKLLWYLRLAKTRATAQAMVEEGRVRMGGSRVERASTAVRVGAVLTLRLGDGDGSAGIHIVRVLSLPHRRGPSDEARACYENAGAL